jgi:quinol monooxygenase YgiN
MAHVWTHGTWTVKPGREEEFVAAWRTMARRGVAEMDAAGPPTLLRDRDDPTVFLTFGPWPSIDAVDAFRASELYRGSAAAMDELLDSFETRTLDEVGLGG